MALTVQSPTDGVIHLGVPSNLPGNPGQAVAATDLPVGVTVAAADGALPVIGALVLGTIVAGEFTLWPSQ